MTNGQSITEKKHHGLVVQIPDLNNLIVDDVHAVLEWIIGKIKIRPKTSPIA